MKSNQSTFCVLTYTYLHHLLHLLCSTKGVLSVCETQSYVIIMLIATWTSYMEGTLLESPTMYLYDEIPHCSLAAISSKIIHCKP